MITALAVTGFLLPKLLLAQQIAPQVATSYSASITKKVYEVAGKVQLSANSQLWLANEYLKQDSSIAVLIVQGSSDQVIKRFTDSTERKIFKQFKQVLNATEKSDFEKYLAAVKPQNIEIKGRSTEGINMSTQFGIALRQYQQLQLTDAQIDKLLQKATEYKQKIDNSNAGTDTSFFNRGLFETENILAILTQSQYQAFLDVKNSKDALRQAQQTWNDLTAKGLAVQYNKDSTVKQLKHYYAKQLAVHDRYWYFSRTKAATETRALEKDMPEALKVLLGKDANNEYAIAENNQFGLALKHQQVLALTNAQIAKLVDGAKTYKAKAQFAKSHPDSGYFESRAFESANLSSILSKPTYQALLTLKNKEKAASQAGFTWHDIVEKGIAANYNKDSTVAALADYFLASFNTIDMYAHDLDARKVALRAVDAKQPEALVYLKKIKRGGNSVGQYVW